MSNTGIAMIKLAAAAGGAVLGILLARWSDDLISSRLQEKSEFDKTRYSQGLTPQQPPQVIQPPIMQPPLPERTDESDLA